MKNGEPLTVVSPGNQKRNFTHVDDIIDALILVGENGYGDEFGIGSEESFSILEIAKLFGGKIEILPERRGNRMNAELVSDHPKLVSSNLVEVFEIDNQLLIITASNGFYLFKNNKLTPWRVDSKIDLNALTIYSAAILKDNSIVIGTVSNGLYHLSPQGNLKYDLNFEKGLSNNTVLSVFEDFQNNLWLGLDIGVSHVNLSSQFVVYNDQKGTIGTVYTSVVYGIIAYYSNNITL